MPHSKPSIMVVGDYSWPWYQEACARALEDLGCSVSRFSWFDDFRYWIEGQTEPVYHNLWSRIQYRFHWGPKVWAVERRLIREAVREKPEVIWFYNVQLIGPRTVRRLKKKLPHTKLVQYANDNPFSKKATLGLWTRFVASIPFFDIHFAYRQSNIEEFKLAGAKYVHLLRSYFIPESDYPVEKSDIPERFKCDVVFAGHYEDDGRVEMLEAICEAGYQLNLFGGGWDIGLPKLRSDSPLRRYYPIGPVTKDEYVYAICGAKVALCFLSTLNKDTYTRRSFQIPAMRTAMLSQYTEDLVSLYVPDQQVVFFSRQIRIDKKA